MKRLIVFVVLLLSFGGLGVVLTPVSASALPTAPPMTVLSMSCVSGSHCFAAGVAGSSGAIAVTFDDGVTWSRQIVPTGSTSLDGISCFGDLVCSAVGTATVTTAPFIVSTTNGGASWTRQPAASPPPGISIANLSSVSCPSTTSCEAVGVSTTGVGVILRKTSASSIWSFTTTLGNDLESVSCAGTVNCYASGTVSSGSDFSALVAATHNSGANWSEVFRFPAMAAGSGTASEFSSIACVDTQCEAVGVTQGMGSVPIAFSSVNSGHTWQQITLPSGFAPASVRCVSVTSCFMAGGNKIMFTSNNGRTLTSQTVPSGITDLNNIKCASQLSCLASGTRDLIVTSDGGHTWSQRTYP